MDMETFWNKLTELKNKVDNNEISKEEYQEQLMRLTFSTYYIK